MQYECYLLWFSNKAPNRQKHYSMEFSYQVSAYNYKLHIQVRDLFQDSISLFQMPFSNLISQV